MSDKNLEQQMSIKFCVKFGRSASETLALFTVAYGEYTMKKSSVFEWHRHFKKGRDVLDNPRSGQSKTQRTDSNVDSVRTLVHSDRRLGVRVIAEELNMNRETVRRRVAVSLQKGSRKRRVLFEFGCHNFSEISAGHYCLRVVLYIPSTP